ncbi:sigma-54-dependent Fis family transcriptional regulator [Vibrio sp. vnigr-6D03]|uniref:cyclic-di-GMP-binding transcriptional regulator VpsR n=1 Tax=Vibrio sp. vnigr-6D03 TaxID=2058088 RepID=UPI000C327A43|nr:cyclic-di-GMP-binding transcriptional regulator VpsR [Vibrio sp. vnigr-6D03]PKF79406.1 sigma-54-dependent Fis family transcriptional regulator [Vibrio sp. vnigr-6D03]
MGTQFRMDSVPGSLVVVGGTYEPWLAVLEQVGWRCQRCDDLREAQTLFSEIGPCIGIVDLSQDEFSLNGLANLVSSHKQVRWLAFIRESQLSSDTICQFIVNFCIDFFTAPIPDAQLLNTIGHQLGMLKLEKKVWPSYGQTSDMGMIGESMPIKRLRDQVRRIGPTDVSILIFGESGSGKEKVAQAIHTTSARSKGPFFSVNCGAISEQRMEMDIFGIDRGDDWGESPLLEQADGGTILFNDILNMPLSQQQHLLFYLQEGKVETKEGAKEVDVRILVANHSDMEKALLDDDFNEELYHRLNVLRINVPSLKERSGDIAVLANHYLNVYSREYNAQARSFSDQAIRALTQHHWPGNVRELMNQIKRVVLMSDSVVIEESQLDLPKRADNQRSLRSIRERSERDALVLVLESHDGQVTPAAKELGVSRATMYRLLNKHNLISETRA